MKREIKFRGKRVDNGEWVYGNVIFCKSGTYILEDVANLDLRPELHRQGLGCGIEDRNVNDRYEAAEYGWEDCFEKFEELLPLYIPIIPESVGQYTGLPDWNKKYIYEGDICKRDVHIFKVFYEDCMWRFITIKGDFDNSFLMPSDLMYCTVIGNTTDNKDLLK